MIEISVPGYRHFALRHLVLDYNGTLAVDGELLPGVADSLAALAPRLAIHVVTADTFGTVGQIFRATPYEVVLLPPGNQAQAKEALVTRLGPSATVAIGNGRNDRLMLATAALGIVVVQEEGTATATLHAADVLCRSITDALELLANPLRLVATLRS